MSVVAGVTLCIQLCRVMDVFFRRVQSEETGVVDECVKENANEKEDGIDTVSMAEGNCAKMSLER